MTNRSVVTSQSSALTKVKTVGRLMVLTAIGLVGQTAHADQVDDFLKQRMAQRNIPAMQVAVIKNNKVVKQATYGTSNLSDEVSANDATLFTINSMTKAFVGVAVMQLVEQKKMDLNQTVGDYLPQLPLTWKNISVRQLLTHNSGLPDVMDYNAKLRSPLGWKKSWALTMEAPIEFEPDTRFKYNQANYVLLGKIIEKVSGMPFSEFIKKHQFDVVGMPRTAQAGFGHFRSVVPNRARGYTNMNSDQLTHVFEEFPKPVQTAAGMSSTASELAKWLIALQNGKLLKHPQSLDTLWTPAVLKDGKTHGFGGPLNGYALGWPMFVREQNPAAMAIGGGRAAMGVYYQDDIAIVILTNLQGGFPERYIDKVAQFYL